MSRIVTLALALALAACSQPSGEAGPSASEGQGQPPAAGATAAGEPAPQTARTGLIRDFAGTPAPDLALESGPDGATQTLADVRAANPGQPILVNLWATWCAPCLKELPTLDRLAARTRGRLVVVPVSQDMEGWKAVTPAFTAALYPNLETRLESQMAFGQQVKAQGLPLTILYDADGREVWRYAGDREWDTPDALALIGVEG